MEPNIDTVIAKYAKRTPKKPSKGRTIFLSILIILIAAGAAIGILFFLKQGTAVPAIAPTSSPQTFNGPSAKEIVDKIAVSDTVLAAENYNIFRTSGAQLDVTPDTSTVVYPQNGYTFLMNTAAEDGLRFTLKNQKTTSSKEAIKASIETTLKGAGFNKVDQDTSQLSSYKNTTYLNEGTVCQIVDFSGGSKQSFLEQGVLCNSHASLQDSYKKVKSLLDTADPAAATSAKAVNQMITADTANPKEKLLSLTVKTGASNKSTIYYYATLETNYEYIGKRPTPSVDDPSSYTLSAELQKNISDPKWGTFLTESI
ncbi:hypothetical protein H7100_01810 [Candidatus Saccharibacteria bacterium]|nr:hypothetical protein [Candidatus Saccharibacteria bacterium]